MAHKRAVENLSCKVCRKQFSAYGLGPINRSKRKYCSWACFQKALKMKPSPTVKHYPFVQCEVCHLLIIPANKGSIPTLTMRFCSIKCRGLGMRGEKNPGWKKDSPNKQHARMRIEYTEWRRAVLAKDSYICSFCGKVGGILQSDHILPFAVYPEFRLEVGNGRAVCKPCHRKHGADPRRLGGVMHWL